MSAPTTPRTTRDVPPQLLGAPTGMTFVDPATILRRQWFFDGKFLRAEGFRADQDYVRALVGLSNAAVGSGVVHGYDVRLAGGDRLRVEAGLALAPSGRVVFLPASIVVTIAQLLARSSGVMDPADVTGPDHTDRGFGPCPPDQPSKGPEPVEARPLYVLTVAAADALCGQEERFGALCQDACDTDADRSLAVDGVTLRLHEVRLALPTSRTVTMTGRHHRGRAASAWYARERQGVPSMISGAGLRTPVWCAGAPGIGGEEVPIALLDRAGQVTSWVDQWAVRRELVETSPQRYWQWRMAMRPLDVFLAQVLQFQCQLIQGATEGGGEEQDDCHDVLAAADSVIADLRQPLREVAARPAEEEVVGTPTLTVNVAGSGPTSAATSLPEGLLGRLDVIRRQIGEVLAGARRSSSGSLAIDLGLVDTPSGGYLPVDPARDVRKQVAAFFGRGVDLRFCSVRPDFIPEALQEAQHAERISLTQGIDDPTRLEEVDVLVPEGRYDVVEAPQARLYSGRLALSSEGWNAMKVGMPDTAMSALARSVTSGGWSWALLGRSSGGSPLANLPEVTIWADVSVREDVLALPAGGATGFRLHVLLAYPETAGRAVVHDLMVDGSLRVIGLAGGEQVDTQVDAQVSSRRRRGTGEATTSVKPLKISQVRWRRSFDGGTPRIDVTVVDGEPPLTGLGLLAGQTLRLAVNHGAEQALGIGSLRQRPPIEPTDPLWSEVHTQAQKLDEARAGLGLKDGFAQLVIDRVLAEQIGGAGRRELRATTDWVMFHRRRTRECEDSARPAPVDLRRYRVLHASARAREATNTVRPSFGGGIEESIAAGIQPAAFVVMRPIEELQGRRSEPQAVSVVEFERGDSEVRSAPNELLRGWLGLVPAGALLEESVIVDVEPEPEEVGLARLAAVERLLPVDASGVRRRVARDELPPEIQAQLSGVDGLIALITSERPAEVDEHKVLVVVLNQEFLKSATEAVKKATEQGQATLTQQDLLVEEADQRVLATILGQKWTDQEALGSPSDFTAVILLRSSEVADSEAVTSALKVVGTTMNGAANAPDIADVTVEGLDDTVGLVIAVERG